MLIIASRYDRDPFSYDHDDNCTGENCRDGERLLSSDELRAETWTDDDNEEHSWFDCPGCAYEHSLFEDFVRHELELELFDRVMSGFSLAAYVERFGLQLAECDAWSVHDMLIVTAEQARYETQQILNAGTD